MSNFPLHFIHKNILILMFLSTISSHICAGEWDYYSSGQDINNADEALLFINQHYSAEGQFRFRYQNKSTLGYHYNFDAWYDNIYQAQKTIALSTDNNHQLNRVFRSLNDTLLNNGNPILAAELEAPRRLIALKPPALSSGSLHDINIAIFDPDLRTQQQVPAPASSWPQQTLYPQLPQYLNRNVQMLKNDSGYYLSNPRLIQVDASDLIGQDATGLETSSSINFTPTEGIAQFASTADIAALNIDDNNFQQLMAFYHLDHSLRYLESLHYSLFDAPIQFDARALVADNSSYYYGPSAILFGIGGAAPDALDGDVILHELGHSIHYQIVRDWAYGHTGAIGEGFGDYWAASYSYRQQYLDPSRRNQEFELDTVFNWDGLFGLRRTTRSLNNSAAIYLENAEYLAHFSVGGELGDELWSTPLFQSLKQAVQQYGNGDDEIFRQFDSIILSGMFGLGRGLKMHDLAESTVYAARTLYPNKDYARILAKNFNHHGLLKSPFKVHYANKYIPTNEPALLRITSNSRQPSINAWWTLDNMTSEINSTSLEHLTSRLELPTMDCGSMLNSIINIDYRYRSEQKNLHWQHSQTLINGTPNLANGEVIDAFLPDVRLNNFGLTAASNKVFTKTLSDRSAIIDSSFAIYLNIEHDSITDLSVSLFSPQGTQVNLLKHDSTINSGFNGYFTLQHDSKLSELAGEPSWGTWRLEITDAITGNSGRLKQWNIGHFDKYLCTDSAVEETVSSTGKSAHDTGSISAGSAGCIFYLLLLFFFIPLKRYSQSF